MWRRPWLLFGIGVLTTVVVMATLAASALVRVQRQHQILRELERLGAGYEYQDQEVPWQLPFAWQYPREVSIEVDTNACDLHAVLALANQLVEVRELDIHNAHVVPNFPIEQVATLTQLRYLSLCGARLTHADLDRLDNLPELTTLFIYETPLEYQRVLSWSNARPQIGVGWRPMLTPEQREARANLTKLGVRCNHIPHRVSVNPHYQWSLYLHDGLPRSVWPEIRRLGPVNEIILNGPQYVDWDLRQLATIPGVQSVALNETSITPAGLTALHNLPELECFIIDSCNIGPDDVRSLCQQRPRLLFLYGFRAGPRLDQVHHALRSRRQGNRTATLLYRFEQGEFQRSRIVYRPYPPLHHRPLMRYHN